MIIDVLKHALELAHEGVEIHSPNSPEYKVCAALIAALEAKDEIVEQPKVRTGNCLRVGVCASEGHKIQPQRTWVGLTDEHIALIDWESLVTRKDCVQAIEAKLKEKNT